MGPQFIISTNLSSAVKPQHLDVTPISHEFLEAISCCQNGRVTTRLCSRLQVWCQSTGWMWEHARCFASTSSSRWRVWLSPFQWLCQEGWVSETKKPCLRHHNITFCSRPVAMPNLIHKIRMCVFPGLQSDTYQEDIYPMTAGIEPALSAGEWLSGINRGKLWNGLVDENVFKCMLLAKILEKRHLSWTELWLFHTGLCILYFSPIGQSHDSATDWLVFISFVGKSLRGRVGWFMGHPGSPPGRAYTPCSNSKSLPQQTGLNFNVVPSLLLPSNCLCWNKDNKNILKRLKSRAGHDFVLLKKKWYL